MVTCARIISVWLACIPQIKSFLGGNVCAKKLVYGKECVLFVFTITVRPLYFLNLHCV